MPAASTSLSTWPRIPNRIAVFRPSRPSGLLLSVPALRALRQAFPQASITLVGTEKAKAFVQRFSRYVDDLLVFPGLPGNPANTAASSQLPGFYAEANSRNFDLAIQLQNSAQSSNRVVARLGAPHWAGFVPDDASLDTGHDVTPNSPTVLVPWPKHLPEVLRYTTLIQRLGIAVNNTELEIPLTATDYQEADQIFQSSGLNPHQTVVLHPGAAAASESWPAERYARVAEQLVAHGWQIAITGREEDRPTTQRLRAMMRCFAADLTGRHSAGAFAATLAKCRLLVCDQTLISHVAAALHTPSIVVASGSDMNRWMLPNTNLQTALGQSTPDLPQDAAQGLQHARLGHQACAVDTDRVLMHARFKLGMRGTLM